MDSVNSTRLEVYGAKTGNCLRVTIALEESGLDYSGRPVNLMRGEQYAPEHLALNPAGKVPVLVETFADGRRFVLTQSNAISLSLARRSPAALLGNTPDAENKALERFFYFLTEVISPSHASFHLRNDEQINAVGLLNRRSAEAMMHADVFVQKSRFMAGEHFSLADISALTIAMALNERIDWDSVPSLRRWFLDALARPTVQRGLQAFDGVSSLA